MTQQEKYGIRTGRNQYGQTIYTVIDRDPAPFDSANVGTYETEAEAQETITGLQQRDIYWQADTKAKKLLKGAKRQLDHVDYCNHLHALRNDLIAEMTA